MKTRCGSRRGAWFGRLVARRRRSLLVRGLARLSKTFLLWYENLDYDIATNGEAFALRALSGFDLRTIVDAGANVGEWTAAAKAAFPRAEVHAFEIAEPTWRLLRESVGGLGGVHCVNQGLGQAAGMVTLRHYEQQSALTSAVDYPHPFAHRELEGKVIAGDAYLEAEGIEHVDFLKIDVEGMEREVLAGFSRSFEKRAIDLVQFEYGRVNIITKALLRDFHGFFRERGYAVGKVYPTYVDFREYDLEDEDFLGPNYLACRKVREDYVRVLAGR